MAVTKRKMHASNEHAPSDGTSRGDATWPHLSANDGCNDQWFPQRLKPNHRDPNGNLMRETAAVTKEPEKPDDDAKHRHKNARQVDTCRTGIVERDVPGPAANHRANDAQQQSGQQIARIDHGDCERTPKDREKASPRV